VIKELESIEAILTSPAPARHEVAQALNELARLLYPEATPPLRQSARTSAEIFPRALALVTALPTGAESEALAQCLLAIGLCAYVSGQAVNGLAPVERAVELFARLGMHPLLRRALSLKGVLLADAGNLPAAIETHAEALEVAAGLGDPVAQARALNNLGAALGYAAHYPDAIACSERVVAVCNALPEGTEPTTFMRGVALSNIAGACLNLGDYQRGLQAAKAAVETMPIPLTVNDMFSRVIAEVHYTRLLLEVDAADDARQHCDVAKRLAQQSGLDRAELEASVAESLCEVHAGFVDVGLSRLSRCLESARVLKGALGDVLIVMVKANELAGRHDAALAYLRELMMHTKQVRLESVLLHHHSDLVALQRRNEAAPIADIDALLQDKEVKLLGKVAARATELDLLRSRVQILEQLAEQADLRSDATGQHSYRVGKLAALLAQEPGWDEETVFLVELAARLHDIGYIAIPETILKKGGLTGAELQLVQAHVVIGADLLEQSNVPQLKMAEEIARFHHEHWDGGGYPFGLAGFAIPIAARITALADVFDALTHRRTHQEVLSVDQALATIGALASKQFDPELTELFLALVPRLRREVGDLDAYLGQAALESPFIRARRKIASTLKHLGAT
jgi:putative two-component system response regulator